MSPSDSGSGHESTRREFLLELARRSAYVVPTIATLRATPLSALGGKGKAVGQGGLSPAGAGAARLDPGPAATLQQGAPWEAAPPVAPWDVPLGGGVPPPGQEEEEEEDEDEDREDEDR